jgi:lipopolysaccharide/colanic/teichoic acid biosynthesis glycosyltransferase
MLKFRTMVVNADRIGGSSSADDDPRITAIGRWLRRTKLDELPQLFNVLGGSMSLVGPRPQIAHDVAKYTDEERAILTVKPGITDWASIRFHNEGAILAGHADPDQAYIDLIRPEKLRLCLEYVRRRSFGTDLSILWMTVRRLLGLPVTIP